MGCNIFHNLCVASYNSLNINIFHLRETSAVDVIQKKNVKRGRGHGVDMVVWSSVIVIIRSRIHLSAFSLLLQPAS